jgi:phage-related protein
MRCGAGGVPLAWRHRKFNPDFGQQRGLGGSYKGPSGGPQLSSADCAGNMVQVAADLMTIFKIIVIQNHCYSKSLFLPRLHRSAILKGTAAGC